MTPTFEAQGVKLKAPFPYFGGKSTIAAEVWKRLGIVRNYVEPFAGSLAVLLGRPAGFAGPETVNDLDCLIVNAWRAIAGNPEGLAAMLIAPVAEVETEAQHNELVRGKDALREKLGDPEWFDVQRAAWWIKGANEWIGTGWATGEGPHSWTAGGGWEKNGGVQRKLPHLGNAGKGINRQLPHLGNAGTGINRKPNAAGDGAFSDRRAFVTGWLSALRDRLCSVRIACGDWQRVTGESVTVKHGLTGVFLDPPYSGTEYVYGSAEDVSTQVGQWCSENGGNRLLRIVLAGRDAEHDHLLALGWEKHIWSGMKGYSKTDDRHAEALWCSPHCETPENHPTQQQLAIDDAGRMG